MAKKDKNKIKETKKVSTKQNKNEKLLSKEEKQIIDNFKIINNLYYSALDKFKTDLDRSTMDNKLVIAAMFGLFLATVFILLVGILSGHVEALWNIKYPIIIIMLLIALYYLFNNNALYLLKLKRKLNNIRKKAYEIILDKIQQKSKKVIDLENIEDKKLNDKSKLEELNKIEGLLNELLYDKNNEYFYTIENDKVYFISNENLAEILKKEFGFKSTKKIINDLNNNFEDYVLLKIVNSKINKKRLEIIENMLGEEKGNKIKIDIKSNLEKISEKKNELLEKIKEKEKKEKESNFL